MARPKLYNSVDKLEKDIESYFKLCDKKKKPYTLSGLAYALDMDRKSLYNYSKDDKFFPTIKKAKQKIEQQLEENLYRLGNNSGIIFNLKNNFNWKDSVEVVDNNELSKVEELLNKIEQEAKNDIK